jgi:hypothetical protein
MTLSRRRFLGGAGVAIALPFLPSAVTREVARAGVDVPRRFLAFYVPNGIVMEAFTPLTEGAAFEMTPILAPLTPHRAEVLVLSGLLNEPARPDGPGDHAAGTGSFLTCRHVNKSESEIVNGVSVDQVLASVIGETRFPSLQVGTEGGGSTGNCDSGYSCAYSRNVSWAGPETPLAKVVDPQVLFDRLFGGLDATESEAERLRRQRYRTSVLDYALSDANRLRGELARTDRRKLDEYMNAIREVEHRIQMPAGAERVCMVPGRPPAGSELAYPELMSVMTELMVLAMQCDLTRVITYMLGNAGSGRVYTHLGIRDNHHELSHHAHDATKIAALRVIDTFEVQVLADLLARMKAVTEPDGSTLLDNTVVFFSSEISDGDRHNHDDLPILLAGGGQGAITTGRHLAMPGARVSNLFLAILRAFGAADATFGDDGTTPLEGLT